MIFPFMFDWTFALLIPAMILAFWAQAKVSTNMAKFSKVNTQRGITGAQVAANILDSHGIRDVQIGRMDAPHGDHYDPSKKVIMLSAHVYDSSSITAVSVAAHEVGHAVQHNESYAPLAFRTGFFPIVRFSSMLAFPLILIGFLFTNLGNLSFLFIQLGIIFFAATVVFHLITLPVEFNASSRAMDLLEDSRILTADELGGAKKVLSAAAMTYVAAATMAISQLLRLLLIAGRRS